ncbi:MAG: hypothetical protein EPO13_04495 [Actinomycetota bacterium]|nr:MAG: hypothetical protein EPO13_04495 [Actinomycetota bacterium]
MPPPADAVAATLAGTADRATVKAAVKSALDALVAVAPGGSVEVRIPPYAVAQAIPGTRHRRGTPPAVVETDAVTWLRLATGALSWAAAVDSGAVRASGQRADLSPWLPLLGPVGPTS